MARSEGVDTKGTFPAGDLTLEGRVWLAAGGRDIGVVLCHPHPLHGGNMYSNVISAVAEALWQHDVSTLRFNFPPPCEPVLAPVPRKLNRSVETSCCHK